MEKNINSQLNSLNEGSELSLREVLFIILRYKKLISIITAIILLITVFYTILQKPIYESIGMIMIEEPSSTLNIFDMGLGQEKNYLENEMEILLSRTTSENVVKVLLDSDLRNNLYLFETRAYKPPWAAFIPKFTEEEIIRINEIISDSLFSLYVDRLRENMSVSNTRNTDMINITITSIDPDEAAMLVNTMIDMYKSIDLEWATGEMSHLKSFLLEQIDKKENELTLSENLLQRFQEEEKIFGVDENSKLLLNNLITAESQLYTTKAEINILSERKKYIQSQLTDEEKKLTQSVSNTINDRMFALKNEIALKESELISAISQQGEEHEIVKTLREKLKQLKNKIQTETRLLIAQGISIADPIKFRQSLMDSVISISALSAMHQTKAEEFEKLVNQYESQLGELPEKVLDYTRLTRNLKIQTETYSLMRQKLEEARINEASQIGKVRIVDMALANYEKVKPNRKVNVILGLIFGLFLGLSIAFISEYFDGTIKSIEEIDKRGLTVLAIIPSIIKRNDKNRKTKKYQKQLGNAEKIERRLITHEDPKSPVSEAFRSLRTSLMYTASNKKSINDSNVILISSSGPGEGKTTTIVNLAITYANLGKKTILVDTDLRKPVTHKVFSIDREPGITRYLSNITEDYNGLIRDTEIDNLSIITCGVVPPNPSEILASDKLEKLIDNLRNEYDLILFDAPPLLAVTDAFVTMKHVDQFILVVRAGQTEKGGLNRAIELLKQTDTKLTGIIVNDVDSSNTYGSGYYYNYYQYYYSDQ